MSSIQSESKTKNDVSTKEDNLSETLQLLKSNDPKERINAVKKLTYLQKGVDEIASLLVDNDAKVREGTAKSLGMIKIELISENLKNYLLAALEDPRDKVCSAAISTIGKLRIEDARERLIPFLEDNNPYIVSSTILSLAQLGQKDLGEKIIRFVESKNYYIQMSTINALCILEYQPAGSKLLVKLTDLYNQGTEVDETLMRQVVSTIGKIKHLPAIPILIEIAQKNVGVRTRAINALIEMNAEEAVPLLIPLLADPGIRIRDAIIRLMEKTNYPAKNILLRPLLNDHSADIRALAVSILAKEKDVISLKIIKDKVNTDSSSLVRSLTVKALCEWLGEDALEILISLTRDPNTEVRRAVVENFEKLTNLNKEGFDSIQILANDQVDDIQKKAKEILIRFDTLPLIIDNKKSISNAQVVPNNIRRDHEIILNYLHGWQQELPKLLNVTNSTKISEIDNSLSKLIYYIEDSIKEEFD